MCNKIYFYCIEYNLGITDSKISNTRTKSCSSNIMGGIFIETEDAKKTLIQISHILKENFKNIESFEQPRIIIKYDKIKNRQNLQDGGIPSYCNIMNDSKMLPDNWVVIDDEMCGF